MTNGEQQTPDYRQVHVTFGAKINKAAAGHVSKGIDFKIYGDDMQLVEIELDPGEKVNAEAGAMAYMNKGIFMQTSVKGGLVKGLKRIITGESFFMASFVNHGSSKSHVAFAAPYPGQILPLDLKEVGGNFLCQKNSFLCAAPGVEIGIAFTKRFGAGLFGGEGFILQSLQGEGKVFMHAGGAIIKKDLQDDDELQVDTGCLVALAPSVQYDITLVGNIMNALFGQEGLFLAKLRGPGTVYLQSMPFARLADRITASARIGAKSRRGGKGSLLGGLLGTPR